MPRRGRSMSSRPMAPAPAPRPAPPAPVHHPPSAVAAPAPQQPGLFKQMAATAAGVAVGSAVGHTVGHAITGSFSGSNNEVSAPAQQAAPVQPMESPLERSTQGSKLCEWEIKQFMDCAQNQNDISLCSGFNEAIKLCKQQNGISL